MLTLASSSSLMNKVDGVWYGLSELFLWAGVLEVADPNDFWTAETNFSWLIFPAAAMTKLGPI